MAPQGFKLVVFSPLQDKSGAVVEMVNPFRNVLYSERDFGPEYILDIAPKMGVVVGLALRRMEGR